MPKKGKSKSSKKQVQSASILNSDWPNPNYPRPSNDPNYVPTGPNDPKTFVDFDLDIRDAKVNDPDNGHPTQQDWTPYAEPKAPDGSPNILYIVLDDTGFGAWSMFGGKIKMPNLERIANEGLIYTNFHTTALCSPTRSSLLNGRNANSNGMACIEEATSAFPGSCGRIPRENAFIAETLGERGYNTYCIGKWHLAPEEESNMASAKRNWPLGRGFERYYGFLGGETDQWYPDLIYDNHIVEPPYSPDMSDTEKGYHLSKDLTDKAISFIQDGRAIAPDKPWMMYFCPGANHAPHQIWPELIGSQPGGFGYNSATELTGNNATNGYGKLTGTSDFEAGYEQYRYEIFAKMKTPYGESLKTYVAAHQNDYFAGYFLTEGVFDLNKVPDVTGLGIFPPDTLLPEINPHGEGDPKDLDNPPSLYDGDFLMEPGYHQPDEVTQTKWPSTEYVIPWDANIDGQDTAKRQELFIRMAETYAAFSSYTDQQIGRLLDFLEKTGDFENTIIVAVADNGASGEGGPNGSINENLFFNDIPDNLQTNLDAIENLGTDKTYNHYPSGWAWGFDAPFKYWKRWSNYEGGDATPFMMCGPGIESANRGSGFRKQYVHAVDLVPTIYDMIGLGPNDRKVVKGYEQNPLEGTSFAYTFAANFDSPSADSEDNNTPQFPYRLPAETEGLPRKVKDTQFYAMLGTRGIWYKGWHACTFHPPTPSDWGNFGEDVWELYCMDGETLTGEIPFSDIYDSMRDNILTGEDASWPAQGTLMSFSSNAQFNQDPTQYYNLMDEATLTALVGAGNVVAAQADLNQILDALKDKWRSEARRYYGTPMDDRSTSAVLGEPRPQLSDTPFEGEEDNQNATYDYGPYYPGGSEIPEAVAPNVRTRSYSITASLDGPLFDEKRAEAKGVLFSHGGRFGGHSLYIDEEGNLCYVYNWLGQIAQKISCPLPAATIGDGYWLELTASFEKVDSVVGAAEPSDADALALKYGGSVIGNISLSIDKRTLDVNGQPTDTVANISIDPPTKYLCNQSIIDLAILNETDKWVTWNSTEGQAIDDWSPGSNEYFMTQPGKFALCGEGMNIGKDAGQPVSPDYADKIPYEFEAPEVIAQVTATIQNDADAASEVKLAAGIMWRD